MNRGSEIHIFWGAPIGPLKMMVSQEPTSLMSTTDPWKKVQLLYNQHSLHLKDEKCKNKNVEDYQILEAAAPPDLLNGRFLGSSLSRSVSVKDDCIHCVSETQTQKFQKSHPLGMSDITKSDVQICGCKDQVQHLTGEEEYQKLFSENKKITVEQHKHQSNVCNVTVYEDHWVDETVLQSTFTTQLLNLGNYSSVQPEEYSSMVSDVVLQDLLAYVSSKHSHLRDLRPRPPQAVSSVEFVALEQLQPGLLVHALLRVVDVTVLTEAVYSYRGQKQRKVLLTVEQAQGQHYVLVLWGRGAAWYPQLQRKKDYIWEFKYLFVQRNYILENLELHTTPWSSCECLFDDDVRVITFKTKFQKCMSSFVKMSDLATHLEEKCSGVILVKAQILELVFHATTAQQIVINAHSSLKSIFSSLPNITYTGCAKCGLELERDENKIYKQCFSCLPCTTKKIYYRPALMTIADGLYKVCVHVGSKLMEKILLNISPDWLSRVIAPPSEVTYGLVAADLLHSLLAACGAPCVLRVQSLFVLEENSYPLQQDLSLLDFSPAWGACS
ncbi:shieldin complex subunit 2 isoform X7 [Eptesicus fuscus]|uniref:shieldin complex subunit 2 isoform X7 n=1 Tax=Eptesicus fuscus TaxID=29078 RepID=UPI0024046FD9|nr:shieldin complex subunit 2 isoform X7 [Eptesicus fuscus]